MRTTVDIPPALLAKAKRLASERRTTLSEVVVDALAAQLGGARRHAAAKPFRLIVRGQSGGHFPTPEELAAVEDSEDIAALKLPGRHVAP